MKQYLITLAKLTRYNIKIILEKEIIYIILS